MILDRLDANLRFKTLSLTGLVDTDDPDSGIVYTTLQAAQEIKERLRPYASAQIMNSNKPATPEEMAAMYLAHYGSESNE